ncbi:MAG: type II toxin-antitoxin system RatA family toxin [Limnobacter sp.]|uniref:type II toxin-antitoxin system RatA family toxin n=1 Tax=Limnobacter sp. TaxID=2003368 RepID=UPI00391B1200
MATVEKSVLVTYPAHLMYDLVRKVGDYPQFLPWCSAGHAEETEPLTEKAAVEINFKGVKQSFCTLNRLEPHHAIHMSLVDGPFRELRGEWRFLALTEDACKVEFRLDYEFSSKVLEQLVGPVFHLIANSFVDSFIKRAESLHG